MQIESGVSLKPYNTFGLPAVAHTLVRVTSDADVRRVVDHPTLGLAPKFVLGGGSNIILTRDMPQLVLKVEVMGRRLVEERADADDLDAMLSRADQHHARRAVDDEQRLVAHAAAEGDARGCRLRGGARAARRHRQPDKPTHLSCSTALRATRDA